MLDPEDVRMTGAGPRRRSKWSPEAEQVRASDTDGKLARESRADNNGGNQAI